jgi:hypothetical protein
MRRAITENAMTSPVFTVLIAALAWAAVTPAVAQDGPIPGADDSSRYSFHRTKEGLVRLDSRTGEVALCGWNGTVWSCKPVPEERAALESEIARLQRENAALKKTLLSHGLDLPGGVRPEPRPGKEPETALTPAPSPSEKSPTEAELDRAIAFMKNVWRRLVEMMADLQREMQRKS